MIITGIIERLISKRKVEYICPAGIGSLSVDKSGMISPCFVFTGSNINIGNINTKFSDLISNIDKFQKQYNNKNLHNECIDCWAKNLCSLCFTSYGPNIDNKDRTYGANIMCSMMLTTIKSILLNLGEIKSSKKNWEILLNVLYSQSKFLHIQRTKNSI